jgi:hypothetical protein
MIQITLQDFQVANLEPDSVDSVWIRDAESSFLSIGNGAITLVVMENHVTLRNRIAEERGYEVEGGEPLPLDLKPDLLADEKIIFPKVEGQELDLKPDSFVDDYFKKNKNQPEA